MAKKKKKEGNDIAGKIITVFFVLLLIGGAYYLFSIFKTVEINSTNLSGTWKLSGNPATIYTFKMDKNDSPMSGEATSYKQYNNSAEQTDRVKYSYEIIINEHGTSELHLQPLNERGHATGDETVITVTGLSVAQMYVRIDKSKDTALTRVDLF